MLDIYVHIVVGPPQLKDQVVLIMIKDSAPSDQHHVWAVWRGDDGIGEAVVRETGETHPRSPAHMAFLCFASTDTLTESSVICT